MSAEPSVVSLTVAGAAGVSRARALRAGPWLFASGLTPQTVGDTARPRSGLSPWLHQARAVWDDAATILRGVGADPSRIVRCDQLFSDHRAVPFFHQARREACGTFIAPSTSILVPELLIPTASVTTDIIARVDGAPVEPIFPKGLDIPSTSSFVPVVKAGDLVFVAGFLAAHGQGDLGGIAPEAKVPDGHLWKGDRIQLETQYLIRQKLVPALAGAGLTLADVVKASVFLRDVDDVPGFNQVWAEAFAGTVPATTIVPTASPGFAIADARIEINLIATTARGQVHRLDVGVAAPALCDGHPLAVEAGDLLLFSGLVAADAGGSVARVDPRNRYLVSPIDAQMEYLLDLAEEACARAGATLRNVVRIGQMHTDLAEFVPACRAWQRRLPGRPLPISAARVPALPVPGCTVQLDLWIHVP